MRLQSTDARRTIQEAARVRRAWRSAHTTDVVVPKLLSLSGTARFPVLYESVVLGYSAARVLQTNARQLHSLLSRLSAWLSEWNRATARETIFTAVRFEEEIAGRAEILSSQLSYEARDYGQWLRNAFGSVTQTAVALVDAHNDLTMRNVLITPEGGLGIVDWEESGPAMLPFTDLVYSIADAVAAIDNYQDRVSAAEAAFLPAGGHFGFVRDTLTTTRKSLSLPPLVAAFAFHACWLHHAWNEHRSGARERPFLRLLNWIICTRQELLNSLGS
jgi:hypothetical protein